MAQSSDRRFLDSPIGSGSLEQDSPLSIVAMEEKKQTCLMHQHRFGKRERHADKTSETLTERIIPALHMGGLSCLCLIETKDVTKVGVQWRMEDIFNDDMLRNIWHR